MRADLVIFDLDGTLIDTIIDLGNACNYALDKLGLKTHSISDYKRLVGNGIMRLIQKALPEDLKEDEPTISQMRAHFMDFYDRHLYDFSCPYEGITEAVHFLKQQGCRLAVASNKYQAATERIVEHFFLNTFDVVLGEREGIPRKPDIHIIRDICQAIPLNDGYEAYVIGDSLVDIQTARNANLPSIACSWGFVPKATLLQEKPDFIVDVPQDIIDLFNR